MHGQADNVFGHWQILAAGAGKAAVGREGVAGRYYDIRESKVSSKPTYWMHGNLLVSQSKNGRSRNRWRIKSSIMQIV